MGGQAPGDPPSASSAARPVPAPLALGLLLAIIAISYFPATLAGFVWDDRVITQAEPVQALSGLWSIWFQPRALKQYEGHYWPLLYTTFWLEHKLWGLNPLGYHLVNLLLHAAVTCLLWHLLRRLAVPGAWLAAALFAAHPVHVEPVVWVIGRKDLLAGLFYLAAGLAYMGFIEAPRMRRYFGALALFGLGLLCKSMILTLPVALLIWHAWKHGRVTAADARRVLPFLAVGLAVTVLDWRSYKDLEDVSFDYTLAQRALIAAQSLWFYAGKLLWPAPLSVVYPHWPTGGPRAWAALLAAAALLLALWHQRRRIGRGPLAAVLFFAVALSPTLGLFDYGYMRFSFAADRYQYLASAGLLTLLAAAAHRAMGALPAVIGRSRPVAVALVLLPLGVLTWQQAGIYRDEGAFFGHITALNPQARSAYYNLGGWLREQGREEQALAAYNRALAHLDSSDRSAAASLYVNLGVMHENRGQYRQAGDFYRRALQAKPRARDALYNLARLLTGDREYRESLELYRRLIALDPDNANAHAGMAETLAWLRRPEEALRSLERAQALDPERQQQGTARRQLDKMLEQIDARQTLRRADANYRRALEHHRQGRPEQALAALRQGLEQSPDSVEIHTFIGLINEQAGRLQQAAADYRRALQIDPRSVQALNHLGALHLRQQRYREALEHFRALAEIRPDFAKVYSGMGVALYNLQRAQEALQSFDKALALDPALEEARANREHVLRALRGGGQSPAP